MALGSSEATIEPLESSDISFSFQIQRELHERRRLLWAGVTAPKLLVCEASPTFLLQGIYSYLIRL